MSTIPATGTGPAPFEQFTDADLRDLIAQFPLAWVLPCSCDAGLPSLLPMLLRCDEAGRPVSLLGHLARRNPLVEALRAAPHALFLFTGPQGYVSPGLVSNPAWAPTWNYAQVRIEAKVRFSEGRADEALAALVGHMDRDDATGWQPRDVGDRYDAMERAIIAFEADITRIEGRFKLGQDETDQTLGQILEGHRDPALVQWMRRANDERLTGTT
ncbi:FMN-binding negative transcriptional regulator [Novosphingobium sp. YJ-S2-02]|uniref:FMN-binding negative transcriptional regulator n=1 Tax=Novosphingobium aureum TaxID=2792964 RepID=A0A931MM76_9SPHN|nr:FMN-binding negative transcriptional regulator [Novosphingobium aureum]MBH0113831.1 FMN-binding negative transcriptional regulator [Novosphingobium aureum]